MRPVRPSHSSALAIALASLLLLGSGLSAAALALPGAAAGAPGSSTTAADLAGPESVAEAQQEFDRTAFLITVYGNGSARWTFRFERTLANETERQDFRTFADQFDSEETALYTDFVNRSERLTASGTNATGREMEARDFRRDARVSELGNEGIVEMSFRWVGFAPVNGDRVVVSDVFEGGLYIRADQRLVFTRGPGVVFEEASPSPDSIAGASLADSDSVTWRGERTFADERPRVVLAPPSSGTSTAGPGSPTGTSTADGQTATTPGAAGGGGLGLLPLVALVAVLLLGVGAAIAYRSGALGGGGGAGVAGSTGADDGGDDPDGGSVAAAGAGGAAEAAGSATDADPEPAVSDAELLSDEERVMRLLEENGGRMKQVNIVDETDWSKSKVSMLLSEMEDADQISKLRVGRENIISKKGMEPEAARSPFEDEDN